MSDVMKAMHRLLNEEWNLLHYDPKDWTHGESVFVKNIRPLTNHIVELHSAIARLKGELPADLYPFESLSDAFTDLFDLLHTDWVGETE